MSTVGSTRLFVAVFAAFAIVTFVNTRASFAQDDGDSATAVSGTSDDANWEKVEPASPPIDENAASADKVLEIPPAKCSTDDPTGPCDGADTNNGTADNDQSINAPSPGAPPQTFDTDTASNQPDADWGNVDDYQNQQAYNIPYPVYPNYYPYYYSPNGVGVMSRPSQVPSTAFGPVATPLTQAVRPPLNQGPWMTPPTTSAFARPAGGPMIRPAAGPMTMSAPLVGFHR